MAAFFAVTRLWAGQIRGSAVRLEQALAEAVRESQRLAGVRERSVQLRLLHDHALQTLETIGGGRFADLTSVRAEARAEAARLERELTPVDVAGPGLVERLQSVVGEQATQGLRVRTAFAAEVPLAPQLTEAFCGAVGEALTNVRKHARTDEASLRVIADDEIVVVTISDTGDGFDRRSARGGFGMRESIEHRMQEAGGDCVIESVPGRGTTVTLRAPR